MSTEESKRVGQAFRAFLKEGVYVTDRARIKLESREVSPPSSANARPSKDWLSRVHEFVAAPVPCSRCATFAAVTLPEIQDRVSADTPHMGSRHDADSNLALCAWAITAHYTPDRVVETGVARGLTSAAILHAMRENRRGTLYSIDLPPLTAEWARQSTAAVAPELRGRWQYIRGSARRRLPPLLRELGSIDIFLHDSLHTYSHMLFEFDLAWQAITAGGLLVSDDIGGNRAFEDFIQRHFAASISEHGPWTIGRGESKKDTFFGVILKKRAPDGSYSVAEQD
jgi:predicted O-methyltransferase YrrM